MANADGVRIQETIGIWTVLRMGKRVLCYTEPLGEMPAAFDDELSGASVRLPVPVARSWGDEPIGRWYAPDAFYGGVDVGFVRPSSHRDIGVMWPEPRKLPVKLVLDYETS